MKFVKGISLFFFYPLIMFGSGMYTGIALQHFFYPGQNVQIQEEPFTTAESETASSEMPESVSFAHAPERPAVETTKKEDVLTADTEYVLEEVDVRNGTSVETVWHVPERYIGMNRESFLEAMEDYAEAPPLQELERGFTGLEVLSFSGKKVVVRIQYDYVEPSDSFYIGVEENYVVVYLEDKQTVYLNTGILLETLPEQLQQQIMGYMFMKGEEELYHFLESYSS